MSSASKKLLKELPSVRAMNEIMSDLTSKGPQTTAIVGTAYVEHVLELLLRAGLRSLPKKDDNDRLYSGAGGGTLGSMSAKIRIAYAAKLIQQEVYEALLIINDIRNVFAHSLHLIDFENEHVAADCARLRKTCPIISSAAGLGDRQDEPPLEVFASFISILFRSLRYEVGTMKEPAYDPYELSFEEDLESSIRRGRMWEEDELREAELRADGRWPDGNPD